MARRTLVGSLFALSWLMALPAWAMGVVGRDYGSEVEIISGLNGAESLITNPTDDLAEGTSVQVVGTQQ